MKKRIAILVVLLSIISASLLPLAIAAPKMYFSAINDKLLPLKESTMPRYINGEIYLHYSFFSSSELGVFFTRSSDDNIIMIYNGTKNLTFDVAKATTFDQDLNQYPTSAKISDGTVFLPAKKVCEFFGLDISVIQAELAPIIRVRSSSAILNNPTFGSLFKTQMQEEYDQYMGISPSPDASPSPSVTPSEKPEISDDITIFISFYDLSAGYLETILDKLDSAKLKCSFFVTAADIAANPDLIRRIDCTGHTIGIYLTEGTFEEYELASSLLFEAAKLKTVLVSSGQETAQTASEMAGINGLVYWTQTRNYNAETDRSSASDVTSKLSTVHGSRESISFDCSESTSDIIRSVLSYMKEKKYSIQRITETSVPIPNIE